MHSSAVTLDRNCFSGRAPLVDPLTGTLARPALLEQLGALKAEADQDGTPFSLYLIDVDHLRAINERWGQQRGDAVLAGIVARISQLIEQPSQQKCRSLLGRFDGDGIMLAIARAELRSTSLLAEQIRRSVAGLQSQDGLQVTVSLGIALYRIGEPLDETLARTEKALHLAKQFGRDCVEVAPSPLVRSAQPDIRALAV